MNAQQQQVVDAFVNRLVRVERSAYDFNVLKSCIKKYHCFPQHLKELTCEILDEFYHTEIDMNAHDVNGWAVILACSEALKFTNGREKVLMLIDSLKPRAKWTEDEIECVKKFGVDTEIVMAFAEAFRCNELLMLIIDDVPLYIKKRGNSAFSVKAVDGVEFGFDNFASTCDFTDAIVKHKLSEQLLSNAIVYTRFNGEL